MNSQSKRGTDKSGLGRVVESIPFSERRIYVVQRMRCKLCNAIYVVRSMQAASATGGDGQRRAARAAAGGDGGDGRRRRRVATGCDGRHGRRRAGMAATGGDGDGRRRAARAATGGDGPEMVKRRLGLHGGFAQVSLDGKIAQFLPFWLKLCGTTWRLPALPLSTLHYHDACCAAASLHLFGACCRADSRASARDEPRHRNDDLHVLPEQGHCHVRRRGEVLLRPHVRQRGARAVQDGLRGGRRCSPVPLLRLLRQGPLR